MIKFFRTIRKELLTKNKIGKYLLYALGEIILVIVGILIALNLNQRSEQKKAEAKIDAIFEDVLKDLETDISRSTAYIDIYQRKDSLLSLVLNTDLTYKDYAKEDSDPIWRAALTMGFYTPSDNAHKVLMSNIDAIPEKYSQSVSFLNELHGTRRQSVERFNKRLNDHVIESNDILAEKPWYTEPDHKKSTEAIMYRLNDYRYKNRVKKYHGIVIRNHRRTILFYRAHAVRCYEEIASVLNKMTDSLDFITDEEVLNRYVGSYVRSTNHESKAEITINNDGFLIVNREHPLQEDGLIHVSSESKFSSANPIGGVFIFNKSNSGDNITMTIHEGHIPVTYTKLKP
ncbi:MULTISPECIES: hypothetical protein [Winogradskyella]|uniref:hypothetical protein n=1 Tax=Winogradskyella TaxID=286104 RepID=UPI001B18E306|nr:hypothetical protein [Winogradskyella sp.]MBO6881256.1 hypothetical protein [Winogradskyella sp.]